MRYLLAISAGLGLALLLMMAIEGLGYYLYPLAPHDGSDPENLRRALGDAGGALRGFFYAAVLIGGVAGGGLSAWLSAKPALGQRRAAAMYFACLLSGVIALRLFLLPQPLGFGLLLVLSVWPAAWAGFRLTEFRWTQ